MDEKWVCRCVFVGGGVRVGEDPHGAIAVCLPGDHR